METLPFVLSDAARRVVAQTLGDHAAYRGWRLLAVNVRTRHVHVVVKCAGIPPEKMMNEFKAWSTRRLREAGLATPDDHVWTRHGSTRYLWNAASLNAAAAYVLEGQDCPR